MDCCIQRDGHLTILDYKSDAVTEETLPEKIRLYQGQLELYAKAMERMLQMPVDQKILYFFALDRTVTLA